MATQLRFIRCAWTSGSNAYAGKGSTGVLFESCKFTGTNKDRNHWGAVGSDGEAEFVGCSAQMFNLDGHAMLILRDCELQDVICSPSARESGGVYGSVFIENSKLRGKFDMVAANLQSLTIHDTVIDTLDLSGAKVKGDIVLERVRGGSLKAIIKGAQRFIVKDSQFTPSILANFTFNFSSNDSVEILIENTTILGDNILVDIGGGPKNKSIIFRNSKFSRMDLHYLHTSSLLLEDLEANSVQLNDARIDVLEFNRAKFMLTLDLSGTQVKQFKRTGGTDLKTLGGLKLDGFNIKLN